jgi:hypothetical protein
MTLNFSSLSNRAKAISYKSNLRISIHRKIPIRHYQVAIASMMMAVMILAFGMIFENLNLRSPLARR